MNKSSQKQKSCQPMLFAKQLSQQQTQARFNQQLMQPKQRQKQPTKSLRMNMPVLKISMPKSQLSVPQ
ncbi:TPA: hypothetical protein ACT2IM_000731 [Streptococcus suis]